MEAKSTAVVGGPSWVLARLVGWFKYWAQQHSCVLELLGKGRLNVEVMTRSVPQRVVLPGARVSGWSWALDACPVKHISTRFLLPVA